MSNPKISIIIPIYNASNTIEACIDSIKTQTLDSWELILVDNNSKDDSYEIIQRIAKSDIRIKCLKEPIKGVSIARNAGLSASTGNYVCFIDSDDVVDERYLESLYQRGDDDLVVCGYTVEQYNISDDLISTYIYSPSSTSWKTGLHKNNLISVFKNGFFHFCWNKLFKKSIIDKYQIRFRNIPINEDFSFVMDYIAYAQSISIIDKPLYRWRHTVGKTSGVDSIPENLLKIYNDSHNQLRLFFEYNSIADEIAYCSYDLIIYKYYHAYKIAQLSKAQLKKRLTEFQHNSLIKQAYQTYKPTKLGEHILHTLVRKGWFGIHYLITQRKFL